MERQILLNGQSVHYTFSRKQVKNINLRIRGGKVFVSAAQSVPLSVIENFMQQKAAWILSALAKNTQTVSVDEHSAYLCGEKIILPPDVDRDTWQKEKAAHLLPIAYAQAWDLFKDAGFSKPVLRLRKMKSRWGSCIPSKAAITLNTALVGAPVDCQIAVAAHELCHMLHPNHSKTFYEALYQRFPDYERCHSLLKSTQSFLLDL